MHIHTYICILPIRASLNRCYSILVLVRCFRVGLQIVVVLAAGAAAKIKHWNFTYTLTFQLATGILLWSFYLFCSVFTFLSYCCCFWLLWFRSFVFLFWLRLYVRILVGRFANAFISIKDGCKRKRWFQHVCMCECVCQRIVCCSIVFFSLCCL